MAALDEILELIYDFYAFSRREDLYLESTDSVKGLKLYIEEALKDFSKDPEEELTFQEQLNIITGAMNRYLKDFPAFPSYKDMIYHDFKEWFLNLAEECGWEKLRAIDYFDERVTRPVKSDVVDLIKLLHPHFDEEEQKYYYYTKKDFREYYQSKFRREGTERGVSSVDRNQDKTVTNMLRALSGKGKRRYDIGGQPVKINVKYQDIQEEDLNRPLKAEEQKIRHYYSSEIINPVVLQADLTQIYLLLESLAYYRKSHTESRATETALDIWCQLSPYCKEKTKEYFADNPTVSDFIDDLRDFCIGNRLFYYNR